MAILPRPRRDHAAMRRGRGVCAAVSYHIPLGNDGEIWERNLMMIGLDRHPFKYAPKWSENPSVMGKAGSEDGLRGNVAKPLKRSLRHKYGISTIFSNRITIFSNRQFCGFAISRFFQTSITIIANHLITS